MACVPKLVSRQMYDEEQKRRLHNLWIEQSRRETSQLQKLERVWQGVQIPHDNDGENFSRTESTEPERWWIQTMRKRRSYLKTEAVPDSKHAWAPPRGQIMAMSEESIQVLTSLNRGKHVGTATDSRC